MKNNTLVMKFGGTSVGSPQAMAQAVDIVKQACSEWENLVVVTSALAGVTNLLLDSARKAVEGDSTGIALAASQLRAKHTSLIETLLTNPSQQALIRQEIDWLVGEFSSLCQAVYVLGEATPRALDAIAGLGERMSVRILAAALESSGVPAQAVESTRLVVTDEHFQDAHPDLDATREQVHQVLDSLFKANQVAVVTGFLGATPKGITTTLGRGGSDYSAAILGAALQADEVWIWTDVDGVMSADPRLVSEARTIPELSFREVSELAYYGAKVLHPKTIRPVIEAGIGLRVCNTFNPSHPGTRILANNEGPATGRIKAVTAIRKQQLITVEGRGMLGVPGVAARTFKAVAVTGTSVPLITQASSEQSICFAVPLESTPQVIASLEAEFSRELSRRDIDRVWATEAVVIITVVGVGMRHTPGVAGRIFSALGSRSANVIAIAQGSSEVSISLVVSDEDTEMAVKAIHELID